MYTDFYSVEIIKKLARLKKKDSTRYYIVRKKIDAILINSTHNYKFLHYDMKGVNRVHIGHSVLVFVTDHKNKTISFEDYDHHDKIYKKK